ncbi:short chain type dehydrogenase [Trichoderma arundinaceum]|uniref:Short chain type dehydrogenase n=1 Tax=Trichoderma arundinaceum TaxID=490622 RepID=A0A395NDW0_TRIAR|nr:short chain type dehydrogenase [Trichoderma arundinaceum]
MASAVAHSGLLVGKVSIITGASSGLGRAMALAFAKQGATIVCADQTPSSRNTKYPLTHEIILEQGGKAMFVSTDVADESDVLKLVRGATNQFGRVDIMVNNAGIAPEAAEPRPIWETSLQTFERTWGVNMRGVFLGCKHAGAQMMRQNRIPGDGRLGTIINVGSILGVLGKAGTPAYSATKGAVIALTRAVAMDYAPHGIHCNSILPGFTRTAMISAMTDNVEVEREMAQRHPLKRLGEPQDIAGAAVFLASGMSDGITGLNLSVDGGLHSQLSV